MTETTKETPGPEGAPAESPEPGEAGGFFEKGRPRLGGLQFPIQFDETQTAVLNAAAETFIPAHDDWPAATEVGLVTFVGRYVTPTGYKNKHFPFAEEDAFKAGLDELGQAFVDGDTGARVAAIKALEDAEDDLFTQLRALFYYGYYSRPEVTFAIKKNVPAAKDYHGPPLPYGYLEFTEEWDETLLASAGGSGSYLATDDVVRVDLSKLSWSESDVEKEN